MTRRKPKYFPPGTFLPQPQRVLAILQLCISFSLVLWYLAQPFMGEYFELRSRTLLYEYVMGTSDILKTKGEQSKLIRQTARFNHLPLEEREAIQAGYKRIQDYAQRPVLNKIVDGFKVLFIDIPAFEVAWLFFSILIALLLLLKVEGSKHVVWILPLLALAYAVDNRLEGKARHVPADHLFFPSEQFIIPNYGSGFLGNSVSEQKIQLQKGWEDYLIDHWLPIERKENNRDSQIETADFYFTLARLHALSLESFKDSLPSYREKQSILILSLYMGWNLLLAWSMNKPFLLKQPSQ